MKKKQGGSTQSEIHEQRPIVVNATNLLVSHPFGVWFWVGFAVLMPVYVWFLVQSDWLQRPPKPVGDGVCYESIGTSLYSGRGFFEDYQNPTWRSMYENDSAYTDLLERSEGKVISATGRPPVLPVLIATTYAFLDRTPSAFMCIRFGLVGCLALSGAMAAGLAALMLFHATKSVMASSLGAMITIGLAASQNTLKEYVTDFLTEPIALVWIQTLITLVVIRWFVMGKEVEASSVHFMVNENAGTVVDRKMNWRWAVSIGLSMGLAILTRSMFIFWVPGVLCLIYLIERGTRVGRMAGVIRVGLVCFLTCLPWWIHNCMSLGRFLPLGTQGSIAMLGGYSDEAYADMGNWSYAPELALRRAMKPRVLGLANDTEREVAISEEASIVLRKWMFTNLQKLPSLAVMRAITHWNPYTGKSLVWKVLIVLGAIWVFHSYPGLRWWILGVPLLSTAIVMALYETGGRFLVPLYGHLFFLGGLSVGLVWNFSRCCLRRCLPKKVSV
ncbi:MAG: hypothetical protein ACK5PB_20275 [Pirellula sp.]|jgi:hypothetical protein